MFMFPWLFLFFPLTLHSVPVESYFYETTEQEPIVTSTAEQISPMLIATEPEALSSNFVIEQNFNQIVEMLEKLEQTHQELDHKITNLEAHQREFMGYIHDHFMAKNDSSSHQDHQQDQDYSLGLTLMKQQKMEAALTYWQDFIERYPQSYQTPWAYYWVGEVYYVLEKDDYALDAYKYLVQNYPSFEKSPEALYKIGQIFYNQGSLITAQEYWQKVLAQYPSSSMSQLAKQQLSEVH